MTEKQIAVLFVLKPKRHEERKEKKLMGEKKPLGTFELATTKMSIKYFKDNNGLN